MQESEKTDTATESEPEPEAAGWPNRTRYSIGVLTAFILAGGITAPLIFPDVHPARAIIGGAIFGVFCTACALMHWFFD